VHEDAIALANAQPAQGRGHRRNALFQLGCKRVEDLLHAPLERVFNISLPALIGRSRKKSFHPLPIYEARHGGRFFAVAQEPESAPRVAGVPRVAPRSSFPLPAASRSALDELDLGDASMARNIRAAKRVASRDVPILLIGETGTGKELFARALHAASERAERSFIAVNCAAIPEAQLQSEMARAHGGTLFLDEIGELPGVLQARLLHVLEKRELRVIAASPSSLEEKIRRGEFREELFYRLQGLVLTLPRFHEREDKRALLQHVFAQEAADTPSVSLGARLIDALCAREWPGNIRQLRNVLRAMIALRAGDKLDVADLPCDYRPPAEASSLNALGNAERAALLRELELERGNISHVARKLGVGRNTLYRKMHRLGIQWPIKKGVIHGCSRSGRS